METIQLTADLNGLAAVMTVHNLIISETEPLNNKAEQGIRVIF